MGKESPTVMVMKMWLACVLGCAMCTMQAECAYGGSMQLVDLASSNMAENIRDVNKYEDIVRMAQSAEAEALDSLSLLASASFELGAITGLTAPSTSRKLLSTEGQSVSREEFHMDADEAFKYFDQHLKDFSDNHADKPSSKPESKAETDARDRALVDHFSKIAKQKLSQAVSEIAPRTSVSKSAQTSPGTSGADNGKNKHANADAKLVHLVSKVQSEVEQFVRGQQAARAHAEQAATAAKRQMAVVERRQRLGEAATVTTIAEQKLATTVTAALQAAAVEYGNSIQQAKVAYKEAKSLLAAHAFNQVDGDGVSETSRTWLTVPASPFKLGIEKVIDAVGSAYATKVAALHAR